MFRLFTSALIAASLVLIGCSGQVLHGEGHRPSEEAGDLVWPPAPEPPRIRHLYSISSPRDIGIRAGFLQRIMEFLKGEEDKHIIRPHGLGADPEGRLYVVDTVRRRVHMFDPVHGTHRLFPEDRLPDFKNPIDVAAGSDGRVYVSDSAAARIHLFSANGRTYEGSFGQDKLKRPTGIAFDAASRRLLVSDTLAAAVVVFDERNLQLARSVADAGGERYHAPTGVAVSNGSVVVSDSLNFRIRVLDHEFGLARSFGEAGDKAGYFARPKGIAVDSKGHIYVVDALLGNVQIFDRDGTLLLAFGRTGVGRGEFWLPNDIFIDGEDRIYVSDAYNSRVQVFQYLHREEERL